MCDDKEYRQPIACVGGARGSTSSDLHRTSAPNLNWSECMCAVCAICAICLPEPSNGSAELLTASQSYPLSTFCLLEAKARAGRRGKKAAAVRVVKNGLRSEHLPRLRAAAQAISRPVA